MENGLKPFRSAIASILSIASLLAADAALAQAGCYTLQAELMRLQEEAGSGDGSQRYERAFREQARVLAATEAEARQAGCFGGGFLFFRSQPSRACPRLVPKIRDMRANLTKLDRLRRSPGGAHPSQRRLGEIKAIMANRGCAAPGARDTTLEAPWTQQRGTFRTLCVRTCDGFFFPISFATVPGRFHDDAQTCQRLCPAAETMLFTHRNPGEEVEQAVSLNGEPYTSMPNAFKYRQSFNNQCSCRGTGQSWAEALGVERDETLQRGDIVVTEQRAKQMSQARPVPGQKSAPAGAGTKGAPAATAETAPTAKEEAPEAIAQSNRRVRIVGPQFYPVR